MPLERCCPICHEYHPGGNAMPLSHTEEITDIPRLQELGHLLAKSGYFADARDMSQAAVKVMAGRELGIPPIASVMGINIIKGKVAMAAHLIASRIRAHGYDFKIKRLDNTGCVLEFIGKDGKTLGESSFTEEDAKAAGVFGDMYPRNMYYSRAVSNGAKWYTAEVLCGMPVYVPEELGTICGTRLRAVLRCIWRRFTQTGARFLSYAMKRKGFGKV